MNETWYKDIMVQNYQYDNYFDPTKLFVALALIEPRGLKNQYHIKEVATYVYRYFVSNTIVARRNFNIVVRNIEKYGVDDIIPCVKSAIQQWIKDQKADSLQYRDDTVIWNVDVSDGGLRGMTRTICETLFQKYYKTKLCSIFDYCDCLALNDEDINVFGKSKLRKLIFEDIQYCPLSEETQESELYVVRISPQKETSLPEELLDKDNLILLSRDVASEYIAGLFYFDEFGRVVLNGAKCVNCRMRLGLKMITAGRKKYILRHYANMKEK